MEPPISACLWLFYHGGCFISRFTVILEREMGVEEVEHNTSGLQNAPSDDSGKRTSSKTMLGTRGNNVGPS